MVLKAVRALAVLLLSSVVVVAVVVGVGGPFTWSVVTLAGVDVGLRVDVLTLVLSGLVTGVVAVVASYSVRNLAGRDGTTRFGWLLAGATLALLVMVAGASLPVVAAGWTVSGLVLSAMVGQARTPVARRAAGYVRRRLLLGDAAVWAAVVVGLLTLPTLNRAELAVADLSSWWTLVVAVLLVLACVVRSALVPVQAWLVETAEAPSPVSALLHAGMVNGAGVMVCLFWPLFVAAPFALLGLLVVGAVTVAVSALTMSVRTDVKGRLAGSTSTQMGYMAVQLGLGLPAAAVTHLVGHGCYKGWLFLRAGGAVTRSRRQPLAPLYAPTGADPAGRGTGASGSQVRVAVAAAGTLAVAGALPAVAVAVGSLGPAAVLPVGAGVATLVVAVRAAGRAGVAGRSRAALALLGAVAVAGYAWMLVAAEVGLAPVLPLRPVWPTEVAVVLLGLLGVGAVAVSVLLRQVVRRPAGRLALRLTVSTLPPWSRRRHRPVPVEHVVPAEPGCTREEVARLVQVVSRGVGPAWPLRTIVAANPWAGLEGFTHTDAASVSSLLLSTRGYLPLTRYGQLHREGRISREDLLRAVGQAGGEQGRPIGQVEAEARVEELLRQTSGALANGGGGHRLPALADEHAALWCARAWSRALEEPPGGPWGLWRAAAADPSYGRATGLPGLGDMARALPEDPYEALGRLLPPRAADQPSAGAYLSGLLNRGAGWAAHAAWRSRECGHPAPLVQLLALRGALQTLLPQHDGPPGRHPRGVPPELDSADTPSLEAPPVDAVLQAQALWQRAYELGFRDELVDRLRPQAARLAVEGPARQTSGRGGGGTPRGDGAAPSAQVVFCIDVRSERLRRALESEGAYQTIGFAGFFGTALRYTTVEGASFDQCPALIRPSFTVSSDSSAPGSRAPALAAALSAIHASPLTALVVAEAGGGVAGAAAVARTLAPARWQGLVQWWNQDHGRWGAADLVGPHAVWGLPLAQRVGIAADALRGMGLTSGFAPLLVICGHGATVENNAFASAYDCGACGGNSGHVNARVLSSLLNDPGVRAGLAEDGISLPATTTAVAAVHDTTTDEVTLDPYRRSGVDHPSASPEAIRRLRRDLLAAGESVRAERRPALPGAPRGRRGTGGPGLLHHVRARAGDWAQPAPEWGLAGNAAFVVGPRELTRGVDLQGRVFLHDYDPQLDPDGAVLSTVLTAPAVVTQWINAQYYASTVDHEVLGSGDKATHNVVGDVGVLSGAHGDLRQGLPWQALFASDPARRPDSAQHEPLRLLVLVWATTDSLGRTVTRHPEVMRLVTNAWITLAAVNPDDGAVHRLTPGLRWCTWPAQDDRCPPGDTLRSARSSTRSR
ncbi:putative inorganic carbon transporter subunit DabA [Aquipuribacter sp. MA13-6]|uniref:putative inorganic carbon transporter subunit DabA n=1 Tax=unclassified Aquipuribacter TaxID=2635084 RepID=UPI003EE945FE